MSESNVTANAAVAEKLLSFRAVGRRIGKSAPTVSRWVDAGLLPGVVRAGDRVLGIKQSAVEQLLSQSHETVL